MLGNETSTGSFEKLRYILRDLEGHLQVQGVCRSGKSWRACDPSHLSDLGILCNQDVEAKGVECQRAEDVLQRVHRAPEHRQKG